MAISLAAWYNWFIHSMIKIRGRTMAAYHNGEKTKGKILKTSARLFYADGYEQTTFDKISKEAGVNPGSIYYHFKTKNNLALIVYDNMVSQMFQTAISACPEENDHFVLYFLSSYVHCYCYLSDNHYRAFCKSMDSTYYMTENADFAGKRFREDQLDAFLLFKKNSESLKRNEKKWDYMKVIFFLICTTTSEFIASKIGEYTIDEILTYWIDVITSILDLEPAPVREALLKARELYRKLSITCGLSERGFEVKLIKTVPVNS
jgi:AcrR family transcriptional regulator